MFSKNAMEQKTPLKVESTIAEGGIEAVDEAFVRKMGKRQLRTLCLKQAEKIKELTLQLQMLQQDWKQARIHEIIRENVETWNLLDNEKKPETDTHMEGKEHEQSLTEIVLPISAQQP